MTPIEDEYKNRFKDQELSNDDFDSEGLWDAISENLVEESNPKKRNGFNRFLLLLFGVVMIGGTYLFNTPKSNSSKTPLSKDEMEQIIDQETTLSTAPTATAAAEAISKINKSIDSDNLLSSETSRELTETSKPIAKNQAKIERPTNQLPKKIETGLSKLLAAKTNQSELTNIKSVKKGNDQNEQTLEYNSNLNENKNKVSTNPPVQTAQVTSDDSMTKIKEELKVNKETPAPDLEAQEKIAKATDQKIVSNPTPQRVESAPMDENLAIDTTAMAQGIEPDSAAVVDAPVLKNEPAEIKTKKNIAWEISGWGGINVLNLNYQGKGTTDLAELKKQSETGELGTSFGLSASLLLKDRWLFGTGLAYHERWSKFEREQETSIQVVKENQLLQVWVDADTGDTLNRRFGDATVDAIATRNVVHYNQYQRFSIPIEFGVQKKTQKLVYGITAGGLLNFTIKQSGKTLDENGEIVEFDKDSATAPLKPFSLGFRLSPFLGYRVTERLTLKINPGWTFVPHGKFADTNIKLNTQQLNLNLGIGYGF